MTRRIYLVSIVLLLAAAVSSAQSAGWRYGGRVSWVNATADAELADTGSTLELRSGIGFEFDAGLMVSDRFGVELSARASVHKLQATGAWGEIDGGRVWLVPLTALAQYHHPVYGPWDPYFGFGVTWVLPLYDLSSELSDAGVERIEIDGGVSFAAQLGANYQLDKRWYANIDLRYIGTSLEVRIRTEEGDLPTAELDIKPLAISLGFGYRF